MYRGPSWVPMCCGRLCRGFWSDPVCCGSFCRFRMVPMGSAWRKEQLVSEFRVFSSHPFQDVNDSSRILGSESLSSQAMRVSHGLF